MSLIDRFLTSFRGEDRGTEERPGLIQNNDGTVDVINPDGTRTQVGVGGGGITEITSDDNTVTIVDPSGPTVDLSANGGSSSYVVRGPFDFAFNTPGLNEGVEFYTPTIDDLLLDFWLEVTTAFDGTTPTFDIGTFTGGQTTGLVFNYDDAMSLDNADSEDVTGYLGNVNGKQGSFLAQVINQSAIGVGAIRGVPGRFTTADPWKIVVSQNGHAGGTAIGGAAGEASLYIVTATPVAF